MDNLNLLNRIHDIIYYSIALKDWYYKNNKEQLLEKLDIIEILINTILREMEEKEWKIDN